MKAAKTKQRHGLALTVAKATSVIMLMQLFLPKKTALAHPLMGDTAATEATPVGAAVNPALAAMVPQSAVQGTPQLFESSNVTVRFPGFDPVSKSKSGLGNIQSFLPTATLRLGRFGLSIADVLPPINAPIAVTQVPLYVLTQQSLVDIDILAKVRGGASVGVGFRVSEGFALGLQIAFRALSADVTIRPTGREDPLATVTLDQSETRVTAGIAVALLDNRLRLGLAAEVFRSSTTSNSVQSDLLDQGTSSSNASSSGSGESQSQVAQPLGAVTAGVALNVGPTTIAIDGQYTRAPTEQKEYSLADRAEKEKELYDTFVVRGGVRFKTNRIGDVLLGGRYDTSQVGQGSKGAKGMAGFSTLDLVQVYAGQTQLRPSYSFGGGIERPFGKPRLPPKERKVAEGRDSNKKEKAPEPSMDKKPIYPILGSIGLVYQKASLGVDEQGEQPAAYTQTRLFIPLSVIYFF